MNAGLQIAMKGKLATTSNAYGNALARYGLVKLGRAGYPIGLVYPPDGSDHFARTSGSETRPNCAGMTFHPMSGLWYGLGIQLTEAFRSLGGKWESIECFREIHVIG